MSTKVYHLYDEEHLNRDTLIKDTDFLDDAAAFLSDRGGYSYDELDTDEKVYDAYMEHFRVQNVNEVTALKDMSYAQETDDESRQRMGRLMDTFDRMDSDLGWSAAGDYLEGVFTAPSTYAGVFTGGAAKAGQLAAQQGLKFGIREAIKRGGVRTAIKAAAIEAPVAAGTVLAQEQTRVETGIKEDIDPLAVGTAGVIATVTGGVLGGVTGTQSALRSFQAEEIVKATTKDDVAIVEAGHEITKKVLKVDKKASKKDKQIAATANKMLDTIKADKLALKDTIPEELAAGKELKEKLAEQAGDKDLLPGIDEKLIQNISAAGARVFHLIPPRFKEGSTTERIVAGSAEDLQERFTSRVARGIRENVIDKATLKQIMDEHGVTSEQLGTVMYADSAAVIAEEVSRAGRVLRGQRTAKELVNTVKLELNEIDDALLDMGDFTSKAYRKLAEDSKIQGIRDVSGAFQNLNKARVGMMTVQAATTVRNTTNGYMRNYVYALDNLGSGLINYSKGNIQKIIGASDQVVKQNAINDVKLGKAQMRVALDSILLKDLVLGMNTATTTALTRLMSDKRFGATGITKELFREMGDVGEQMGAERGALALARKLNTLNTMSDNMFKRAIFARELDKAVMASSNGEKRLADVLREGNFGQIPTGNLKDSMDAALDFTYQTGKFKGKEGGFNTFADAFIQFGQSTGGSLVVPFPRYMINQFRFVYEHAPILGMFDFGGVLNKSSFTDRAGKQLTGLTLLGTFAALRSQFGDETTGPYEYLDPTTRGSFDMRASLGPFSAYAMFTDFMYRKNFFNWHDNDKVAEGIPYSAKEFVNAITGGQGRAGTGLDVIDGTVDVLINGLENGIEDAINWQNASKAVGNYLNTYTVGAGVLKDLVATIDPDFRQVPDNTDVEIIPYMLKVATRSFPQTVGDSDQQGLLGYTGVGPTREKLESPTRSGGLRSVNPFIKQLTGLTPRAEKTVVEKELDRLRFEYYELSPRLIKMDRPLTNEARGKVGRYMETEVSKYILGDEYTKIGSDKLKRQKLKEYINQLRTEARNLVLDEQGIDSGLPKAEVLRRKMVMFTNKVPAKDRLLIEETYKHENDGRTIKEDDAWDYAIEQYNRLKANR